MSKKQRGFERANQERFGSKPVFLSPSTIIRESLERSFDRLQGNLDTMVRPPDAPAAGGTTEVPVPVAAAKPPATTWDDVVGQTEAKAALIDAIETPIRHRGLFAAYGQRHSKGVLLYGSPGNGKTLLAKAAAAAFAALQPKVRAQGQRVPVQGGGFALFFQDKPEPPRDDSFIYLKGPELKSMWHGRTEENIRTMFQRARDYHKSTGCRSLVFVDEAETLMGHRDTVGLYSVPTFLAEMDGLSENGPFMILATNRQDALDPAIVRPGRIDRKIEVTRPTQDDARAILALNLRGCVLQHPLDEVATNAAESLYSGRHVVHAFRGPNGETANFTLDRLVSGAVVVGVVREAIAAAMRRDILQGANEPSGVCHADVELAIASACEAEKNMNHGDEVRRWAAEMAVDHVKTCTHCGGAERRPASAN